MKKAEEIKKCLLAAQRLGMDLVGLHSLNLNLNAVETQYVNVCLSHLDSIVDNLNNIYPLKEELKPEQETKRAHGSIKL